MNEKELKFCQLYNNNNELFTILQRKEDGFINATQLCKAGNKQFKHWNELNSTKNLIDELSKEINIPIKNLLDIKKGGNNKLQGSYIYPLR